MRALIVALSLAGGAAVSSAIDVVPADTVLTLDRPSKVVVVKQGKSTEVKIIGTADNKKFRYTYTATENVENVENDYLQFDNFELIFPFVGQKSKHRYRPQCTTVAFRGLYAGPLFAVKGGAAINDSWQFGLDRIVGVDYTPFRHGPTIGIGIGYAYRQLSVSAGYCLVKQGDELAAIPIGNPDVQEYHGRIRTSSFQVPLTLTQNIYKSFGISLGVILDFNTYTKAHSDYRLDGREYEVDMKGLHQRAITPELYGSIGFLDVVGVYARYMPVSMFKEEYGPTFKTFSVGVTLGF